MNSFANAEDIVNAWRPLSQLETTRAEYWTGAASRNIRRKWKDIDTRIAAGDLTADDVKDIVVAQVINLLPGLENNGKKSISVQAGNMARSYTLQERNDEDRLHFEKWMLEIIEGKETEGALPLISAPDAYDLNKVFPTWQEHYSR